MFFRIISHIEINFIVLFMEKIKVIDEKSFVFEGVFDKIIIPQNVLFDKEKTLQTIKQYKEEVVDKGNAIGILRTNMLQSPSVQETINQNNIAFMIIDVWLDDENNTISGKFIPFDYGAGEVVVKKYSNGEFCYLTYSETKLSKEQNEEGKTFMYVSSIGKYGITFVNFNN